MIVPVRKDYVPNSSIVLFLLAFLLFAVCGQPGRKKLTAVIFSGVCLFVFLKRSCLAFTRRACIFPLDIICVLSALHRTCLRCPAPSVSFHKDNGQNMDIHSDCNEQRGRSENIFSPLLYPSPPPRSVMDSASLLGAAESMKRQHIFLAEPISPPYKLAIVSI